MLYDWANREISDTPTDKPVEGRLITWEPGDRYEADASRGLTPVKLDNILRAANSGDCSAQARLAEEVEEKDYQAFPHLQTRRAAVRGLEWACKPRKKYADDANAKKIAEAATEMLESIRAEDKAAPVTQDDGETFGGALDIMLCALLPGYSLSEIMWGPGGEYIESICKVATSAITFTNSQEPLLRTREATQGLPLAPNKFIFHRHMTRSGDATRGGLIRPLAWMHVFSGLGIKGALRFVERYGMPFLLARLDEKAWREDRTTFARLVRNFGSDGGAVFTKSVEAELLDGGGSGGDVYFKLLEHIGDAKTKCILGQLASSASSSGLSGGDAQSAVRQDLLESDCVQVERTVDRDILAPWTMYNYGPDAPVPEFVLECKPPEDMAKKAEIIGKLNTSGYQIEPSYVETEFGMPLVKDQQGKPRISSKQDLYQYHLLYGIPTKNEVRTRLGLPPVPGGDKPAEPIETQGAMMMCGESDMREFVKSCLAGRGALLLADETETPKQAANKAVVEAAVEEVTGAPDGIKRWLGKLDDAIQEAAAETDDPEEFGKRLRHLLGNIPGMLEDMETSGLEDIISRVMFAAKVNGKESEVNDGLQKRTR